MLVDKDLSHMSDAPGYTGFFPYLSYDAGTRAFFNVDGSLGMIWEILPISVECLTQDELGKLAERVACLLRALPEGAICQFILRVTPNIPSEGPLFKWAGADRNISPFLGDLARRRIDAIKNTRIPQERGFFVCRTLQLLLTLRLPAKEKLRVGLSALLEKDFARKTARQSYATDLSSLVQTAALLESSLSQIGIRFTRLGDEGLAAWLFRTFNSSPDSPIPAIVRDPGLSPQARACDQYIDLDHDQGQVRIAGRHYGMLSVTELPYRTFAGILSTLPLFLEDGLVVLNLHLPPQLKAKEFLERKRQLAFCQISQGQSSSGVEVLKGQIDSCLAEIETTGARTVNARIHLIFCESDSAKLAERASLIGGHLAQRGFGAIIERVLMPTLFFQSMPLAYDPANDKALKRARKFLDVNLAHCVPVYGFFPGTRTPDLLLQNRLGEIVTFSFFDADEAPHGLVTGISGSGKSVLANTIIVNALRQGGIVFVLDVGASYRKLCEILGGTYIDFDPMSSLCINPCGREINEVKCASLVELLVETITAGKTDVSQKIRSILSAAIREAFENVGGLREVAIGDIRQALESRAELPEARDAALVLELFSGKGNYARLFDGPCNVDFSRNLVVFELGKLASRKEISSVVLLSIIQRITDFCEKFRERRKYLIIDEAWTFLDSEATSNFIRAVYKTYRKLNTSAIAISQQLADFSGRAGEAIRDNAPNKLLLRQNPDALCRIGELLGLSSAEKETLGSLVTHKGHFSEVLILSPKANGVARLVLDPASYWITTSDSEDNAALGALADKLRASGEPRSIEKAVLEAARAFPHGARGNCKS